MSMTVTRVHTKVAVYTRAVTYIADRFMEVVLRLAQLHGIHDPTWIDRLDETVRGPRMWLLMRELNAVVMEVFHRNELVAKYEFPAVPKTGGDAVEYFEDRVAEIEELVKEKTSVAPATHFRLLCDCVPGRHDVPGWSPCAYADDGHLRRTQLTDNLVDTNPVRVEAYMYVKGDHSNDRKVHVEE